MKAYTISRYSKSDDLQLVNLPMPEPKEQEVLIEIHAASVNVLDSKIKSGEFKLFLPYKFPLILGHDIAGIVRKVGVKVQRFKVGDEVFAKASDFHIGGFAEFISVPENDLAMKPTNISMEEAASLPLVALTAWQAFFEKANLQKGQKVFIQAGSGGVGTIAIQIAKYFGATVATTTSSTNIDLVKSLGADVLVDYKKEDFESILKDYDLVLNSQDEKTLEKSLQILEPGGKIISISGPPDTNFAKESGLSWFMKIVMYFLSHKIKNAAAKKNVDYTFLFMKANGKQLSEVGSLVQLGKIKPVIDKIFPFNLTNDALSYIVDGRAKGKVVIKIK
jgi:NADPH:quinone reductase-like Zn-dependent oxidoreductase